MSKRAKWSVAGLIVLLVVAVVALSAFKSRGRGTEVRIEPVETRDLVASVTASGQVQPRTKVNLSADITGRITRLAVKEGDLVTRNQFLLQIDPEQYSAAVQRAEAGLASARAQAAQARANHVQAERNHERSAEIQRTNPALVSTEQMEQLKTQLEVTEAMLDAANHAVEQAQASLRDARQSLGKTTIRAPMSGRVTRLNIEEGETAIMGTLNRDAAMLLTISDMSVLETKVRVDETNVSRVSVGDSAVIEIDAFPDTTFRGRVVQISNSSVRGATTGPVPDQAVDFEVTIQLLDAPADTRPDFSATAKVVTATRVQALSIPIIALTVREQEAVPASDAPVAVTGRQPTREVGRRDIEGVFVVGEDNKVTFRPVQVGIAGERHFEVISGLEPGDRIVAGSYQAIRGLRDGTLVREATTTPSPVATTTTPR
ncbi:MAG TPA: efflux RND transporter periplasmic adaptor subunit [Gemmatimonadaceae bacterium]|nr:efflux RND transporter periplasmic adaptor subunit [Gemmatimonadaceae bacterium]